MSEIVPLIYTSKGNLPIESLDYQTHWEVTPDQIAFIEEYRLEDEVVKSSIHVYNKKPLDFASGAGNLG